MKQRLIGVLSGKGGVGKSMTTVNLAKAIAANGKSVGIIDCDITGASIPGFLGVPIQEPKMTRDKIIPFTTHDGLQIFSAAFFQKTDDQPMALKGKIRAGLVQQMLDIVDWNVDYLVMDLPPGSNDEVVYLIRQRKEDIYGMFIVTTPSDKSVRQIRKSVVLCQRLEIPLFGIISNMDGLTVTCPKCQHVSRHQVFGNGGNLVDKAARDFHIDVVARLPIKEDVDNNPIQFVPALVPVAKKFVR